MDATAQLESLAERELQRRGLLRAPGPAGFVYKGELVKVTLDRSVYTGWFVTVHDRGHKVQQFRARAGAYDWNAIAALIKDIAERRLALCHPPLPTPEATSRERNQRLAKDLETITGSGPDSVLHIEAAHSPGQVRVRLPEIELDAVSVLKLFAVVRHALPPAHAKRLYAQAQAAL